MVEKIIAVTCSLVFLIAVSIVGPSEAYDPESVVAYWLFEKDDQFLDSSGNGHDGASSGGVIKSVEGKFGDALEFTGGSYVIVPHDDQLTVIDFTIMAWVNIPNLQAGWQAIVRKGCFPWPNRNYLMGTMDGFLHWATVAPGGDPEVWFNTAGTVADGDWHHIVITSGNGMGKAYIDGEMDTEKPVGYEPMESTCDLEIGSQGYLGVIDEVLIANQEFSEEEIKRVMELGLEQFMIRGMAVSAPGKLVSTWGFLKNQ